MLDYVAYLTAQREVRDLATSALPTAPTRPDPGAPAAPGRRLRRRAARALVRQDQRIASATWTTATNRSWIAAVTRTAVSGAVSRYRAPM
jgi:hypothetical protein